MSTELRVAISSRNDYHSYIFLMLAKMVVVSLIVTQLAVWWSNSLIKDVPEKSRGPAASLTKQEAKRHMASFRRDKSSFARTLPAPLGPQLAKEYAAMSDEQLTQDTRYFEDFQRHLVRQAQASATLTASTFTTGLFSGWVASADAAKTAFILLALWSGPCLVVGTAVFSRLLPRIPVILLPIQLVMAGFIGSIILPFVVILELKRLYDHEKYVNYLRSQAA